MNSTDWKSDEVRKLEDEFGIDAVWCPGKSGGVSLQIRQTAPQKTLELVSSGKTVARAAEDWGEYTRRLIQAARKDQADWLADKL